MLIFWTDEKVAELKTLWTKGDSAAVIGKTMGATRNAILGKVHRLGLEMRGPLNGQYYGTVPRAEPRRSRPHGTIFKSREIKPKLEVVKESRPAISAVTSVITGQFIATRRLPTRPELTKTQLRAELALAMANTAAMT